jgi:hypothetical protein
VAGKNWNLNLNLPQKAVNDHINRQWPVALKRLGQWLETDFVNALVYGGMGITGIAQTPFYQWVSSQDGLSELGIEASEPPKLLDAYLRTIKIKQSQKQVEIQFGDMALLKLATPHPAAGTGHLKIESWHGTNCPHEQPTAFVFRRPRAV